MHSLIHIPAGAMVILSLLLWGAGCHSVPESGAEKPEDREAPKVFYAEVVKVNTPGEYVILECNFLPSPGEEVKVYRERKPVSRLRITGVRNARFVAADILAGEPTTGDRVGR